MANTPLTITQVTRKSLMVLHQRLNFIGNWNRGYDDQYAKEGAKIGSSLKIRLPNQYTVRSGAVMSTQDTTETSVTLAVTSQKGVDMAFTSVDLTLSIDDFADRIIDPAMSVLAAAIEADCMSVYKDVYQQVNNVGAAGTLAVMLGARKKLTDALAPESKRFCNMNTQDPVDLVDAFKAFNQDNKSISTQYLDGGIGRLSGFDCFENSLWTKHTPGSEVAASSSTISVNGANQTGASITVTNGSSKTLKQGDIITLTGCNRCHPESKADTGALQQFVVTADVATSGTSISISPSIILTGATQNCIASPTTATAINKIGVASTPYGISMAHHRDAFTFATADLWLPETGKASRAVQDGISMRLWQASDITNDKQLTRIDVLYGFKTIRPELAVRIANN